MSENKKDRTQKQRHSHYYNSQANNRKTFKKDISRTEISENKKQQYGSGSEDDKLKQRSNTSRSPSCKSSNKTSSKSSNKTSCKSLNKTSSKTSSSQKRADASKKIRRFISKNKEKLRSKRLTTTYLKTICADSGDCISFGTEVNKINGLFDNFTNFKYAKSPVITLGEESQNGFVKQIKYIRNDYECCAILKSSLENYTDNLMYEYEVGVNFINKQNKIFPCFLETYGLYKYVNENAWLISKTTEEMNIEDLKDTLQIQKNIDYSIGCPYSKHIAILIQYVKNIDTLSDYAFKIKVDKKLSPAEKSEKAVMNCLLVLYQIYMPLVTLSDQFTHYDLHMGNVLLYEPVKGSYITYNYHLSSGKIVQFKCSHIAKMIDYGRSYYNNGIQNSHKTNYEIKKTEGCDNLDDIGLGHFIDIKTKIGRNGYDETNYLCSHQRNVSSDLHLANLLYLFLEKVWTPDILKMFKLINFRSINRTKEKIETGLPEKINNIMDFLFKLEEYITDPSFIEANNKYFETASKLGDFHIYQDGRPMIYKQV